MDSERAMRTFVVKNAAGAKHIADLFCGIGNFTYALDADGQGRDGASKTSVDGFDIVGPFNKRDLFKNPLTTKMLNNYDLVVMDPPRAGADAQCKELARSNVRRVIYVSCNPNTLRRDTETLMRAGFTVRDIAAFDQFVGSPHWELAVVFEK
jgi:23S rRNA (uracil1939-C5)-methyltransferase